MCTVTIVPRRAGYLLAMNRDEQITRPAGLPPEIWNSGTRKAIYPYEIRGGTWIGVNDCGTGFALVNWYSVPRRVVRNGVSRGVVVKSVLEAKSLQSAEEILDALPLGRLNPFRLVGVFPAQPCAMEWQWDQTRLESIRHPWRMHTWISSGHDERGAQKIRGRQFRVALLQASAGRLDWLRRLHRSHQPARGPYSICMHRPDAVTVSYTEIVVTRQRAVLRYQPEAPCHGQPLTVQSLQREPSQE